MNVTEDVSPIEKLRGRFPDAVLGIQEFRGETTVTVRARELVDVCTFLRDDPELQYTTLLFVTGLDRLELGLDPRYAAAREALLPFSAEARFSAVYQLYSIPRRRHLRLKVPISGNPPRVPTVSGVWPASNWHERETYDLMGIVFEGHPYLRRILMPDDWVGHPLRKDYPLGG